MSRRTPDLVVSGSTDAVGKSPLDQLTAWVLLVAGAVGFVASFVLAVEKYLLLTNPFYVPSCSISTAVACGPVMSSDQAALFGFPNPYLGIAGFAVVAATGAMMLAGAPLFGWYAIGLQLGATAGIVWVGWMIVQSLLVIRALCLYCMIVWAVTSTVFWYVSLHSANQYRGLLPDGLASVVTRATRNHSTILVAWLLVLTAMVVLAARGFGSAPGA